jgi:hypothetical protein
MVKHRYSTVSPVILVLGMSGYFIFQNLAAAAIQTIIVSAPQAAVNFSGREIQLPQFNPSLGSLESITIDAQGTGAFLRSFDHNGPAGSHRELSRQSILGFSLQTDSGEKLVTLIQQGARSGSNLAHQNGDGSGNNLLVPIRTSGHTVMTSDKKLMEFTGCGFIDLFLSGHTSITHSGSGNEDILGGVWVTGANIKVTYTYAAVPEASSWLAGAFALGLVWLFRRSHTKNALTFDSFRA